jgi:O-antigen ligase
MSSDLREARAVRVLAAAAVPALAVAVYLTLSRGAILAGAIGVVAFLLLARGRGVAATLLAVLPCSCLALLVAYDAGALVDDRSGDAASARQGAEVARAVLSACAGAGLLRIAGLWVDARLASARLWRRWSLARTAAVVAASAAALIAVGIAAGADRALERQLERFVASQSLTTARPQDRLTEASANGRIQHWEVALEAWQREPLVGHGAGTYANIWAQERPVAFAVQDAHSLYVEVLSDLGLVGAILLAGALGVPLIAMVLRRREDRVVWSAALAIVVTWLVHAGMDWDWEMPALTLPVIALLAAATVRRVPRPPGRFAAMGNLRLVSGLAVLLLALTPARVGLSDRQMSVALTAFERGDCRSAITSSLAALETLSSRPQPLELLGYCDVRTGRADLAVRMLEGAVRRDPDNWEMHYGLAIVRGAARRDPRPQLRRARELNPLSPIVADARRRLRSDSPRVWRREALRSKLVLPE